MKKIKTTESSERESSEKVRLARISQYYVTTDHG